MTWDAPRTWVETPGGVAAALNRYDRVYGRGEIFVGERCPGCGVVCAHLDVEHLDDCPFQGRDALTLVEPAVWLAAGADA